MNEYSYIRHLLIVYFPQYAPKKSRGTRGKKFCRTHGKISPADSADVRRLIYSVLLHRMISNLQSIDFSKNGILDIIRVKIYQYAKLKG